MSRVIKSIFFIVFLLFFCPTFVFAEDITITTYYPSPFGSYKNLDIYNQDDSNTQTDFTQAVNRAGLLITTDYVNNRYTPGIFWRTQDNNPTRPKAGIYLQERATGTRMYFGTSNSYATGITNDALVIHESGRVGIGDTNPGFTLTVNGTAWCTAGVWASDLRWKENITTLDNPLEKLLRLRGVEFEWKREEFKDKNFPEGRQIGIIAQELEKEFPEMVFTDQDGYKAVAYNEFIVVLLEAVKAQQEEIKGLKEELASIHSMLEK